MIDGLDDAFREFLTLEMPIRDNEIEVSFDQPKREWAARLSRPTINVFLRDIRENAILRSPQPSLHSTNNGNTAAIMRRPVRVDLYYLVTAWATDSVDEHRMLGRVMSALFRYRAIPDEVVERHLTGQEAGVSLMLAQYDTQSSPNELWGVLDNELRPSIDIVATVAMNPFAETTVPVVRGLDVTYKQIVGSHSIPGARPEKRAKKP